MKTAKKSVLFGPAMLVTAAFIGPGTVLTASQAGAKYGFSLLWAVVFASLTAMILQEMAGRLGIASGSGLAQAVHRVIPSIFLRGLVLGLTVIGIFVGNSAFQTGNLLGAAAGVAAICDSGVKSQNPRSENQASAILGALNQAVPIPEATVTEKTNEISSLVLVSIAALACLLILAGRFDWIQFTLTTLVLAMSAMFLLAALISQPDWAKIGSNLIPNFPPGSGWVIVGLIGTTVVPYNLFLHANAAARHWPLDRIRKTSDREKAVQESAKNTRFAVSIGGLITASILVTAAVAFDKTGQENGLNSTSDLTRVSDIAVQLEPVLGSSAKVMFGMGLFAAGLTSAITAPVAAAYAVGGTFGWGSELGNWRLKAVALIVLLSGLWFAIQYGASPNDAVLAAQAANGLLLPIIAALLWFMMNQVKLVTRFRNRMFQNLIAGVVIGIVTLIAARQVVILIPKVKDRFSTKTINLIREPLTESLAKEV